ncbi:LacI family transcriptional regulator [Prauserella marina]|uniref:LacI family transcriptional regulator n=1 Tax=Prauserella marina TaxID=530584 RepID=A0A222VX50_9PSEU|nr:substrate-binding domain-containing protein [Prauserella marina]ASR38480.1 LacI family transcriptional regulator [Prauserella marina]PWV78274.1 LacI family transcriptional regulator [Prauserella marina]SDC82373.1 LacI family transcriptional regulator [Prauserella marina]
MSANKTAPVTLRTLADQLGLHVSTVSRVLHADPEASHRAASSETFARVRKLADELGYRPNPHATSLRTRRSNLVGVVVPQLSDIVLATIYEGIEESASDYGLSTFVTNTRDDPGLKQIRTEMMLDHRVDGMIFGDASLDPAFLGTVAAKGVPFVLVNRRSGDYPSVTCDDFLGGKLVGEHLLGLGHRDVGVVAGEPYASTGVDRSAGFLAAYAEAGIEIPAYRVTNSGHDARGGHIATEKLLASGPPPSALFAVNDFAAIGAFGALRDHGLRAGEDIAVAGFNDTPLAAELPVPLTTVRSPMREMGRRGLALLAGMMREEEAQSQRLLPQLVVRASTTGPR